MNNIKTHMNEMQKKLDEMFQKKTLGTKECEKCGNEFEIYQIVARGKVQNNKDNILCFECKREEEDKELMRNFWEMREKRKFIKYEKISVVPFELENENIDTYKPENVSQENALLTTKHFLTDELDKTTLFFQGDTGLGKTHLSYSVYKHYKNKNKESAIFVDLPSLLSIIRGTYNNRGQTQEDVMDLITSCDLFVLDDIGAEYVKPDANGYESWAADILFQIANNRQGKKNIYTTNFSSKHLSQKYGMMSKRIISRLMSNAMVVKVEGQDHRLRGLG